MQLKVDLDCYTDPGVDMMSEDDLVPNDDIWKKFEMVDWPLHNNSDLDTLFDDAFNLSVWCGLSNECGKDTKELRHHDCMWAGHCDSEKHEKLNTVNPLPVIKKEKITPNLPVTCSAFQTIVTPPKAIVPTSHRSLLVPTVVPIVKIEREECERPETPQSLSEGDDDFDIPELKVAADFIAECWPGMKDISIIDEDLDYSELPTSEKLSIPPTVVTGQNICRTNTYVKQETLYYNANSDHSYHLTKVTKMEHLGVQTPSDSEEDEEEIDVVSIQKPPNSRSSSCGGGLPTNPSLQDRQQLQLTVATAMCNKKDNSTKRARTVITPTKFPFDDRTFDDSSELYSPKRKYQVKNERTAKNSKRKNSDYEDYEDIKPVKRKRVYTKKQKNKKNKKRNSRGHNTSSSYSNSSDSEVDSTERRSLHNNMERQRRVDLRIAFDDLRKLIPDTIDNAKAPKVVILNKGADYCQQLTDEFDELSQKKAELNRQQEMLRAKVSQLRRSLASGRQ